MMTPITDQPVRTTTTPNDDPNEEGGYGFVHSEYPAGGFANRQMGAEGLEVLQQVQSIKIERQKYFRWDCCHNLHSYNVTDDSGRHLFTIKDQSAPGCSWGKCPGHKRAFEASVSDRHNNEVLHFNRPHRPWSCCPFPACYPNQLQALAITSNGQTLGRIQQPAAACRRSGLEVIGPDDETVKFNVVGSACLNFCNDVEFTILRTPDEVVGSVTWKYPGCCKWTMESLMDSYVVAFESNLSNDDKALMIGMAVLLDLMYRAAREGRNRGGGYNGGYYGGY